MIVYRILHEPTGMFYCPSRDIQIKLIDDSRNYRYVKSNLSKTGKTYLKKPTLKYLGEIYYTHLIQSVRELGRTGSATRPVIESEWHIVEVS